MNHQVNEILKRYGITATPTRIMIYKSLESSHLPLSLSDIETILDTVDKSTISRTLSLFKEKHLVHSINDGSGSVKYELCNEPGKNLHDDLHVHFRCEKCGTTRCLEDVKIPEVQLPEGYYAHEKNYILTGICADCTGKREKA